MAESFLGELMQTAARIMELDEVEGQLDNRDWKKAKEEYDAAVGHFNSIRGKYVDALLDQDGAREWAAADVEGQLTEFRANADPSWFPAINYTEENLLPYLRKQAGMNPKLRRALKLSPYAIAAIIAVAYFTVRFVSATPITQPIETKEGLIQRAEAAEKALRYDDLMHTHVRRGGWLKGALLWPVEPTDSELEGAAQFVGLVLEGQKYAQGCGAVTGYGDSLSDAQEKLIGEVADYFEQPGLQWENPPLKTIIPALEGASTC